MRLQRWLSPRVISLPVLAIGLVFALPISSAAASKQVVDYFGTESGSGTAGGEFNGPQAIAVNSTGAGPADRGEIYVVDGGFPESTSRIQRFARDDNGTPAEPADDSYRFVSAWGAGVLTGGTDYEICTVAASCKPGVSSGGNGTAAGNGAIGRISLSGGVKGIAVDQDTGDVYVTDADNARVNVYQGDGTFIRSFGYDVVESGPDQVAGPDEQQQLSVKATSGMFSLSFRGKTTGTLGTARSNDVGLKTLNSVVTKEGSFTVGEYVSGRGIPPGTTITKVEGTELTISQPTTASSSNEEPIYGDDLPFNASAAEVEAALNSLPSIGGRGGSVIVEGGPGDGTGSSPYTIHFTGSLAGEDLPPVVTNAKGLDGPQTVSLVNASGGTFRLVDEQNGNEESAPIPFNASAATVEATLKAVPHISAGVVSVSGPAGGPWSIQLTPTLASSMNPLRANSEDLTGAAAAVEVTLPASTSSLVDGGAFEICTAANGDICKAGGAGPGVGELGVSPSGGTAGGIAVSPADGDPDTGTVFLADAGNHRVDTYRLDGTSPSSLGSEAVFKAGVAGWDEPKQVAVDSRGIVYASNRVGGENNNHLRVERYDSENADGTGIGFLAPIENADGEKDLAVEPDTDGTGPQADILYVLGSTNGGVLQFGPTNAPGLISPPSEPDEIHGTNPEISGAGIATDSADGRIYLTSFGIAGSINHGVYILGNPTGPASASLDSLSDITANSVTAHATITPNGPPATKYHLEYSTDGSNWSSTPTTTLGVQDSPQDVTIQLNPPGGGLEPNTLYHVRLVAAKPFKPAITTPELTFNTLSAAPLAETTGAPDRTATTAQLGGRVTPLHTPVTYSFEYGDQGPCDSNPCASTEPQPAGSGNFTVLVSEGIEGLSPGTTYHYRLVVNGGDTPSFGEDMTLTTRSSDAPLAHGQFPGPPGSDRAWEQISSPDTGGNPVLNGALISDDGTRAVYGVSGGTPSSETGAFNQFFTERTPSGWQTKDNYPERSQVPATSWAVPLGRSDLSKFFTVNWKFGGLMAVFSITPAGPPSKLYEGRLGGFNYFAASDDGSTVVAGVSGSLDPNRPVPPANYLYEISSGSPRLVSLLPGDVAPSCGVAPYLEFDQLGASRTVHWLSPNGERLFFSSPGSQCKGPIQIYMRNLSSEESTLVSGHPISGPDCGGGFVKSTPSAVFFWSKSRLASDDTAPAGCENLSQDGDVYRYDLSDGSLKCLTCVLAGAAANVLLRSVNPNAPRESVAVAEDGSRIYFQAASSLLPGARSPGIYRLDVASGNLAYISSIADFRADVVDEGGALTPDGSVFAFRSNDPALNPLGGPSNGGTEQYYRYDDRDRSLVCISCPADGSAPRGDAPLSFARSIGPNQTPLAADGNTIAFTTPSPLLPIDQNTAAPGQEAARGLDVYEWRNGRLFLVTDGLTNWAGFNSVPHVDGITPSGHDILFDASAQYTSDALDDYQRLYDARIGGGIQFPKPPPPCPLEVCQGTPKGAPEEASPGTASLTGPGNPSPQGRKAHKHKKHKKRKHARHHRANHKRRTAR